MEKEKYYKILADNMHQKGFQFKEGLNVDDKPFDPTPICKDAFFFATKGNIHNFLGYGNLIAEVEIPEGEQVVKVQEHEYSNIKFKAHQMILKNVKTLTDKSVLEEFKDDQQFLDKLFFQSILKEKFILDRLSSYGANVHTYEGSAFKYLIALRDLKKIQYLVEHGADVHSDNDIALREAIKQAAIGNNDFRIVKYLVSQGANVHVDNDSALITAIYKKDFDMVKFLVDHGADVHAGGDNALFFAIERKNIDDVKFIVEHGANTNAQIKDSKCALNFAVQHGKIEIVQYLIEKGADIHAMNDQAVWSAASEYSRTDILKFLVKQGANLQNYARLQAESVARDIAIFGDLDRLEYLVEHGANGMIYDFAKDFLCEAATFGQVDIIKYLKENGVDILKYTHEVLIRAAENGEIDVLRFYAERTDISSYYYQLMFIAQTRNNHETIEFLMELSF